MSDSPESSKKMMGIDEKRQKTEGNNMKMFEDWEIKNVEKMLTAIGNNVQLTADELHTIQWLAKWEDYTVNNVCTIIQKLHDKGI